MKQGKSILSAAALVLFTLAPPGSFAQTSPPQATDTPALADGEVRKIDKETGKLTLRHGPIRHLDMPPMSMVFTVRDKTLLDKLKAGDRIRFMAVDEGGKMIVTDIQPAR